MIHLSPTPAVILSCSVVTIYRSSAAPTTHRSAHHRSAQHRSAHHRSAHHRSAHHRSAHHRSAHHRSAHHRSAQPSPYNHRSANAAPTQRQPLRRHVVEEDPPDRCSRIVLSVISDYCGSSLLCRTYCCPFVCTS